MPEEQKDDYEILSHDEIQSLRDELRRLKDNPASSDKSLQASMQNLTKVISDLMALFKDAEQQMKLDKEEEEDIGKKLDDAISRLKVLEDQNEKIASAMVAIADMVEHSTKSGFKPREAPAPVPTAGPPPSPEPFNQPRPPMPGSVPNLDDPFADLGEPPRFEGLHPPSMAPPARNRQMMPPPMHPPSGRPPLNAPPMPPRVPPKQEKKSFSLFKKK